MSKFDKTVGTNDIFKPIFYYYDKTIKETLKHDEQIPKLILMYSISIPHFLRILINQREYVVEKCFANIILIIWFKYIVDPIDIFFFTFVNLKN